MPKIVDHEAYRRELLQRAFEFFAEHGFSAVTMRRLATALNVSTGTLYHYFANKDELFEQMAEMIAASNLQDLLALVGGAGGVQEKLELLMEFIQYNERLLGDGLALLVEFHRQVRGTGDSTNAAVRALRGYRAVLQEHLGAELGTGMTELIYLAAVGYLVIRGIDPGSADAQGLRSAIATIRFE